MWGMLRRDPGKTQILQPDHTNRGEEIFPRYKVLNNIDNRI